MEDPRNYLLVLIEEYKSLRDESKQISINMFTALQWGAALLGVIIAAAFTQWGKQDAVVLLTFYIIVPMLSAMAMFLWLGEAERFKRVGDYICLVEQKAGMILDEFKQRNNIETTWSQEIIIELEDSIKLSHSSLDLSDPLAWEQWLKNMKGKEGHRPWIYKIRLLSFLVLMCISFIIAVYYTIIHPNFLPVTWQQTIKQWTPKADVKIMILFITSLVMIAATFIIAIIFGGKLNVTTKAFRRKGMKKDL